MINKHLKLIEQAAKKKVQVLCLQELFYGPYFCAEQNIRWYELTERVPEGPTTKLMQKIAAKHRMVIVVPVYEEQMPGLYFNTAAVIDADGKYLGKYRKHHIPHVHPGFWEKFYFTPGDLGFRAFDTAVGRIGTLVCWDQWYPEAARLTALAGADVLFYPTAIGWHPREKAEFGAAQVSAWQTMQRAHAIANGVYVAAVNRVGHEGPADGGIEFWGASFVCDPFGAVIAEAPRDAEAVLVVEVDRAVQEDVRRNWPFLRDRRIDAYGPITQRLLDR
jgi:N-carbamoylputrescine amidase